MRPLPTLLISDDDPAVLAALARSAHMFGMLVIRDDDSRVRALAKLRPDVILLDINQRVNGRELLVALKDDPDTKNIPVVVMTATSNDAMRGQCLKLGAIEFVLKPFDMSFMARISRLATLCADGNEAA
jgi:CheY-like chemotaxis protein